MAGTLTTFKNDLVTTLKALPAGLGVKTVQADLIVQMPESDSDLAILVATFPALVVNYLGRSGSVEGTETETDPTYAVTVAVRNVAGPNAAMTPATVLMDAVFEAIDGKRISAIQQARFEFLSDVLLYQDHALAVYQMTFRTRFRHARR